MKLGAVLGAAAEPAHVVQSGEAALHQPALAPETGRLVAAAADLAAHWPDAVYEWQQSGDVVAACHSLEPAMRGHRRAAHTAREVPPRDS